MGIIQTINEGNRKIGKDKEILLRKKILYQENVREFFNNFPAFI